MIEDRQTLHGAPEWTTKTEEQSANLDLSVGLLVCRKL
jgi:hypothetical protein